MKQSISIFILSLLISPQAVLAQFLTAAKLGMNEIVNIDGKLTEKVWKDAIISDKFYSKDNVKLINNNSIAHFCYDDKNIYASVSIKKAGFTKKEYKKFAKDDEQILSNEWVAFSIDTYNDGVTSYTFFVDINGNQFDGTLNSSKDLFNSFSTNWESAISYNKNGYSMELKIPLKTLPIQESALTKMGILFVYNDKDGDGEFQFPFIPDDSKNKIDQFQKVFLKAIRPTHPKYLSGVNILERLAYKKSKITDLTSLEGRAQGGDASVMDYYIFKKRNIKASKSNQFLLKQSLLHQPEISRTFMNTGFMKNYYPNSFNFENFLERSQTAAFIVLQNDTILYEKYFNGFKKASVFTSFSMAKSFVSILVGIAIKKGYIKNENDKITDYIPELIKKDFRFASITIKDLLSMSSGIGYSEEGFPSDDDLTYISPDLEKATLNNIKITEEPNKNWIYNNYNPILLGIILKRATKMSVSKFLEENLWSQIGTKNASWSLDEVGFEKMESGFNCIPMDYARIGLLMMNQGRANGQNILTEEWIQKSTQPEIKEKGYYDFFTKKNIFYQYFWWGKNRQTDLNDFFAMGNKGEYLYLIPSKKLIIIRLGFEYGMFTPSSLCWPELFYEFGTNFNKD